MILFALAKSSKANQSSIFEFVHPAHVPGVPSVDSTCRHVHAASTGKAKDFWYL